MEVTASTPCWAALCDPDPSPHCAVLCLVPALENPKVFVRPVSLSKFFLAAAAAAAKRGAKVGWAGAHALSFSRLSEAHMGQVWALTVPSTGERRRARSSLQHTGRTGMALGGLGTEETVPCQVSASQKMAHQDT